MNDLAQLKSVVLDMASARIMAAIRRKFPGAKVSRVGNDIVIEGQEPIDAEFRSQSAWSLALVKGALR